MPLVGMLHINCKRILEDIVTLKQDLSCNYSQSLSSEPLNVLYLREFFVVFFGQICVGFRQVMVHRKRKVVNESCQIFCHQNSFMVVTRIVVKVVSVDNPKFVPKIIQFRYHLVWSIVVIVVTMTTLTPMKLSMLLLWPFWQLTIVINCVHDNPLIPWQLWQPSLPGLLKKAPSQWQPIDNFWVVKVVK